MPEDVEWSDLLTVLWSLAVFVGWLRLIYLGLRYLPDSPNRFRRLLISFAAYSAALAYFLQSFVYIWPSFREVSTLIANTERVILGVIVLAILSSFSKRENQL